MAKKLFREKKFSEKIFLNEIWEIFLGRVRETPKNAIKKIWHYDGVKYFPANYKYNSIKWIQVCKHLKIFYQGNKPVETKQIWQKLNNKNMNNNKVFLKTASAILARGQK